MPVFSFEVNKEALKRNFSVYVVWAKGVNNFIYIGKTGDNRSGCNPIISRCGNHFSYNNMHSQIRNKIKNHERYTYKYYFVHFDEYSDSSNNRESINKINEMERWLNHMLQEAFKNSHELENFIILNPLKGKKTDKKYQTKKDKKRLNELIEYVINDIKQIK